MALETDKDFDRFVALCIRDWEGLTELEREWPDMDDEERAIIAADWPSNYQTLWLVEEYARTHPLTEQRCVELDRLHRLVEGHQRTLERLQFALPKEAA